jgi:hypothetical protein
LAPKMPGARSNGRPTKPTETQALASPPDRLALLPLGRLHSYNRCAYCGATSTEAELRRRILGVTYAEAVVCTSLADCLRRRLRRAA